MSLTKSQFSPYIGEHEDDHDGDEPLAQGGGFGGLGSRAPGLGGLGGLGSKAAGGKGGGRGGGIGGLGGSKPAGGSSTIPSYFPLVPDTGKGRGRGAGSAAGGTSGHDRVINEQIKAMHEITKAVDALADRTIVSFKQIADRLNAEPAAESEETDVKKSLDLIINGISERLKLSPEKAYLLVPGHEYVAEADADAIQELLKDKKVTIVGDVRAITRPPMPSPVKGLGGIAIVSDSDEEEDEGEEE